MAFFLWSMSSWAWVLSTVTYSVFEDLMSRDTISSWDNASVSPSRLGWSISWRMSMSCVASAFSSLFSYLGIMYSQYGSAREVSVVTVVRNCVSFLLGLSISFWMGIFLSVVVVCGIMCG